jgi:hypothetical protein
MPPACPHGRAQARARARPALCAEADGDAARPDIDPLDQQLHDARLLGGEELIPERTELQQRFERFILGDVVLPGAGCAPRSDDDPAGGRSRAAGR